MCQPSTRLPNPPKSSEQSAGFLITLENILTTDLILYEIDIARTALAKAVTIQETKNVLDVAVAAETYAKRQKMGEEAVSYARTLIVEALCQLGRMLKETPRAAVRFDEGNKKEPSSNQYPTLADLGLDKKTSKLAQDIYALPEEEIEKVKAGVMSLHDANRIVKRAERIEKLEKINEANQPLNDGLGKFNVILADPPWQYEHTISDSRMIENQYPTMEIDEILALPVQTISEDDAVIFLWATTPMLKKGIQVLDAWGFEYRTAMVWVKPSIGPGWWVRNRHEHLLIGTRGNIPTPKAENKPDSVIEAPREEHSKKPEIIYSIIEDMYPTLSKIELFSRQKRDGWSAWGNQA